MMKYCQKINLQEPQRNRNATANYLNLIMTSTVSRFIANEEMLKPLLGNVNSFSMFQKHTPFL